MATNLLPYGVATTDVGPKAFSAGVYANSVETEYPGGSSQCVLTQDTTWTAEGTHSLKAVSGVSGFISLYPTQPRGMGASVTPGATYTAWLVARQVSNAGLLAGHAVIVWFDGNGDFIYSTNGTEASLTSTGTALTVSDIAPPNAALAIAEFTADNASAVGDAVWLDEFGIFAGSTPGSWTAPTAPGAPVTPVSGRVGRNTNGTLSLDARLFRFAGCNVYWLGCDDNIRNVGTPTYPTNYRAAQALTTAASMGLKVVRSHTLGISLGSTYSVETALDTFNDAAFEPIDYAIWQASLLGLRVIIPLIDMYRYYTGGKWNFVHWYAGPNDCPNGDFETDISGWSPSGLAIAHATDNHYAGAGSLKMTLTGTVNGAASITVPVTAGIQRTFSGNIQTAQLATGLSSMSIEWLNSSNAQVGSTITVKTTNPAGTNYWAPMTAVLTPPTGAVNAVVSINPEIGVGTTGNVYWFDRLQVASVLDTHPDTSIQPQNDFPEQLIEQQFYYNPTIIAAFERYIAHRLNHVNTYTNIALKDDPTVLAIETGNELYDAPFSWTNQIATYIKSIAPNVLVADGAASGTLDAYFLPGLWATDVDIIGSHYYPPNTAQLTSDAVTASAAAKAYVMGEYDWTGNLAPPTLANWQIQIEQSNISGDCWWSLLPYKEDDTPEEHFDGYQIWNPAPSDADIPIPSNGGAASTDHAVMAAALIQMTDHASNMIATQLGRVVMAS